MVLYWPGRGQGRAARRLGDTSEAASPKRPKAKMARVTESFFCSCCTLLIYKDACRGVAQKTEPTSKTASQYAAKRACLRAPRCSVLAVAHLLLLLPQARWKNSPPWPPRWAAIALKRFVSACLGIQLWWRSPSRNGQGACSQNTCSPRRRPRTQASGAWRRPGRFVHTWCFPMCGADSGTPERTAAARTAVLACRRVTCSGRGGCARRRNRLA